VEVCQVVDLQQQMLIALHYAAAAVDSQQDLNYD
jgi:hypothetical protein